MTPTFYVIIISYGPNDDQKWRKKFCGPKVKVKVMINGLGRLLWFFYLIQFLTDLDNSFCTLFTIGWTTINLFRILNFYLKTKWHCLKLSKFYFSQISE